jgi:hypothetical protein
MPGVTEVMRPTAIRPVPHRPAISNVLIKASANIAFRTRLLTNPRDALADMNLPPEDVEILSGVQAPTLKEYAHQVKMRLMAGSIQMADCK